MLLRNVTLKALAKWLLRRLREFLQSLRIDVELDSQGSEQPGLKVANAFSVPRLMDPG